MCKIGDAHSEAIDAAISMATQPRLRLPSGGKLWCQRTHSLWAIDIDGADADIEHRGFDGLFAKRLLKLPDKSVRGMSGPID